MTSERTEGGADRDAAEDRHIGAKGGPFSNEGLFEFILPFNLTSWIGDIGEGCRRATEDPVF